MDEYTQTLLRQAIALSVAALEYEKWCSNVLKIQDIEDLEIIANKIIETINQMKKEFKSGN